MRRRHALEAVGADDARHPRELAQAVVLRRAAPQHEGEAIAGAARAGVHRARRPRALATNGDETGRHAAVVCRVRGIEDTGRSDGARRRVLTGLRAARGGADAAPARADGVERAVLVLLAARRAARMSGIGRAATLGERAVAGGHAARLAALRSVGIGLADLPARAIGVLRAEREAEAGVGAALVALCRHAGVHRFDERAVAVAVAGGAAELALRIAGEPGRAAPDAGHAGLEREVASLRGVAAVGVGAAQLERVGKAGVGLPAGPRRRIAEARTRGGLQALQAARASARAALRDAERARRRQLRVHGAGAARPAFRVALAGLAKSGDGLAGAQPAVAVVARAAGGVRGALPRDARHALPGEGVAELARAGVVAGADAAALLPIAAELRRALRVARASVGQRRGGRGGSALAG